ncbi:MAG: CocE/NonD family hydrolase [Clostridia bacterium]|nr:CocE/NonD family hydrolase [Clostridia bacterium]
MSATHSYYLYIPHDGVELFTVVVLPQKEGKFPTVIMRNPYVDFFQDMAEDAILSATTDYVAPFTQAGYALVFQHCRGRGKSGGDCIPFLYERTDGLHLQDWIRSQPFYNGELFPVGGSYTSAVHYETMPFAPDVKGAVLEIMDVGHYNRSYRNGFFKIGLAGGWYVDMYKHKTMPKKNYAPESFNLLPLTDFCKTVFGEPAKDFEDILMNPDPTAPYWSQHKGIGDMQALAEANIPILFVTGFYDIFTGGIFDMWPALAPETREKCALLVHPYDHGNDAAGQPIQFEHGSTAEVFGNYQVKWLDYVRGKGEAPVLPGKVTYHKLFAGEWVTEPILETPDTNMTYPLGDGEKTYVYNPFAPASFQGGLSTNFGGAAWQGDADPRYDIISYTLPAFTQDTYIKGKMSLNLRVRSDCEDTCFYVRVSLLKEGGAYSLRDDIQQISNICSDYRPGEEVTLPFSFDEHALVAKAGEALRVDISSSAFPLYVRHTNQKGPYYAQTTAKVAHNTVIASESTLVVPIA